MNSFPAFHNTSQTPSTAVSAANDISPKKDMLDFVELLNANKMYYDTIEKIRVLEDGSSHEKGVAMFCQ